MDARFADIIDANRAYAEGFRLGDLAAPAARGLGVLTCIDSRIEPLAMLGLAPGDAKIFRNAGARATDDAIRSLVLATNLLDVRRIMVVAHTDCAMSGTTDAELWEELQRRHPDAGRPGFELLATTDPHARLEADVARIRACELLPAHVVVAGFEYDVRTGLLAELIG
jgi:carbonic anhydrase